VTDASTPEMQTPLPSAALGRHAAHQKALAQWGQQSRAPTGRGLYFVFWGGVFFFIFIFCSTRALTQGLHLEPLHQPYFCKGFFEIGSRELFAWVGFKPQLS
jgi:hypothetical protein